MHTPGLRGTPAGITTISAPARVLARPSLSGRYPSTLAFEGMCDRSAATPGVLTISYRPSYTYDVSDPSKTPLDDENKPL